MNFNQTAEFKKELKQFTKSYRSVPNDLLELEKTASILHLPQMQHLFSGKSFSKLTVTATHTVVKARFDCASLGSKGLLRIIAIVNNDGSEAIFVELYSKSNKPREDFNRIKKYL